MKLRVFAIILPLLWGFTAHAELIGEASSSGPFGYFSGYIAEPGFGVFADTASGGQYCCRFSFMAPGSYLLQDGATSLAFGAWGFFDLDGIHYTCPAGPNFECAAGIDLRYTLTLPDIDTPLFELMVLTAPLTFDAFVEPPCEVYACYGPPIYAEHTGVGLAAVTLLSQGNKTYSFLSAQYYFGEVPEPATMTLAGLGLLAVILLRRRAASAAGRTSRTSLEKRPAGHRSV